MTLESEASTTLTQYQVWEQSTSGRVIQSLETPDTLDCVWTPYYPLKIDDICYVSLGAEESRSPSCVR